MLRDLIPADHVKSYSANEWKRIIVQQYNQDAGNNTRSLLIFSASSFVHCYTVYP